MYILCLPCDAGVGDPCDNNSNCTDTTSNSKCNSSGACQCLADHYENGTNCQQSKLFKAPKKYENLFYLGVISLFVFYIELGRYM